MATNTLQLMHMMVMEVSLLAIVGTIYPYHIYQHTLIYIIYIIYTLIYIIYIVGTNIPLAAEVILLSGILLGILLSKGIINCLCSRLPGTWHC